MLHKKSNKSWDCISLLNSLLLKNTLAVMTYLIFRSYPVAKCIKGKRFNSDMLRNWNFCETGLTNLLHVLGWSFLASTLLTFQAGSSLCVRAGQCTAGCLAASLASDHHMPAASTPRPLTFWQKYLQTMLDALVGGKVAFGWEPLLLGESCLFIL